MTPWTAGRTWPFFPQNMCSWAYTGLAGSFDAHPCSAANLRIGIYNGEMVFNRLLGNGWSDLSGGRYPGFLIE